MILLFMKCQSMKCLSMKFLFMKCPIYDISIYEMSFYKMSFIEMPFYEMSFSEMSQRLIFKLILKTRRIYSLKHQMCTECTTLGWKDKRIGYLILRQVSMVPWNEWYLIGYIKLSFLSKLAQETVFIFLQVPLSWDYKLRVKIS